MTAPSPDPPRAGSGAREAVRVSVTALASSDSACGFVAGSHICIAVSPCGDWTRAPNTFFVLSRIEFPLCKKIAGERRQKHQHSQHGQALRRDARIPKNRMTGKAIKIAHGFPVTLEAPLGA